MLGRFRGGHLELLVRLFLLLFQKIDIIFFSSSVTIFSSFARLLLVTVLGYRCCGSLVRGVQTNLRSKLYIIKHLFGFWLSNKKKHRFC